MRRIAVLKRPVVLTIALALLGTACTIRGPKIVIEGVGAGEGGVVSTAAPGSGGTTVGGSKVGGGTVGGGGGGIDPAKAEECKGKSTAVGVTGTSIKLGSTFAISGPVSSISGPILKGVRAYINEVNANGGIHGRKVDFKFYDDGWDAQRGKARIKQLVEQDQVFVLVSVPSSNGLNAATSYLEQKKVPVLGTSGLIESQFRAHMQWPVGTSSRSAQRIGMMNAKRKGANTLAIVWLDLEAGYEAREALGAALKAKFQGYDQESLVADYRIGISEPSFERVWNGIQDQARKNGVSDGRPDYVFLAIDPTNAVKAMQAAERMGFRPKIGWGGAAPLFLDLVLKDAPYAVETGLEAGTSFFPPVGEFLNNPAVQQYVKTVQKYYADVDLNNPYLEGGYAGAAMALDVLEKVGPCLTREAVVEAANTLTNYAAAGLTNPMTFKPLGAGPGHYGNTYGLVVRATPRGQDGCTRSIGCWRVMPASSSDPFFRDPTPGR